MNLFIATGIAPSFAIGTPKYVCGLSGTELVHEVLNKSGLKKDLPDPVVNYECSKEYWCGWRLAYYQNKNHKQIYS